MSSLVSIIIPNYNHKTFLQKRLETVLKQTYQDFEVILLDDASNDDSLTILNQFKNHPKVSHFLINKKNSGSPFAQWKKGIDLAKGDFIWIAESDDFSDLHFLEKTMSLMEPQNNLSLVFSNSIEKNLYKNTENKIITGKETGTYNNLQNVFLYNWFFNHDAFRILNASSCVFKKEAIDDSILNKIITHRYSGDKFFWSSILIKFPYFGYVNDPLNFHTFHQDTTRSKNTMTTNLIRNNELLEIYKYCGFLKYKDSNRNRKNEIGIRLIMLSVYEFILNKKIKFKPFFKGLFLIKWNKSMFGKIYRLLHLPN
jgi:glycosyltransferase involved in cell wall biosynthesis